MKKIMIMVLFLTTFLLSSCSGESLNQLEEKIRTFDYYTEIFTYKAEYKNIRLFAAYSSTDSELTYIYYSDEIESDYEILVIYNDSIIYEDFVVDDYEEDNQIIGTFKYSDFVIEEDIALTEIRVVSPGFILVDSYVGCDVAQEFYILSSITDNDVIERVFVDASDYKDKELEIDGQGVLEQLRNRTLIIIVVITVALYCLNLYLYKSYYSKQLQKQLVDSSKKRFLPDITKYKYVSFIIIGFLALVAITTSIVIIDNGQLKFEFYDKYQLNYEAIESDSINLRYGSNKPTTLAQMEDSSNQMAFVEKLPSHGLVGYLEVMTGDLYPVTTTIRGGGYGGFGYKLTYRHLMGDDFTIIVYDQYYEDQEISFKRVFDFDGRSE